MWKQTAGIFRLIRGEIQRRLVQQGPALIFWLTAFGMLLSLLLLFGSEWLGIGDIRDPGPDVKFDGYLEKINWTLFVVFFPILWALCVVGWNLYMEAWRSCVGSPRSIMMVDDEHVGDDRFLDAFLGQLNRWREQAAWWALAAGMVLTALDFGCLVREFYGATECFVCKEHDFSNAFKYHGVNGTAEKLISRPANLAFDILAYTMQGFLIALAILALFQVCLHSCCFLRFEKTEFAIRQKVRIVLDRSDPFGEFGLFAVNNAINFNYILIAIAMLVPTISAYVNAPAKGQEDNADIGQILLRTLVPLILLVPAVASSLERNRRLAPLRQWLLLNGKKEDFEDFEAQRFWPSDQRFVGILGKIAMLVCIAEYGYVVFHDYALLINFVRDVM